MCRRIGKLRLFVRVDPLVLLASHIGEPPDGRMDYARQVPLDEPRMSAGNSYFRRKRQVVTNEHGTPECNRRRKRFVVRVPKADHEPVVISRLAIGALEQPEVAEATLPQRVRL